MNTATSSWLSGRAAALRLGISVHELQKLAMRGVIRTLAEPGKSIRFHSGDVERVATERPASSSS